MLSRLFGPQVKVHVTILGMAGGSMVRWNGSVSLRAAGADVAAALRAAGSRAGVDLLAALAEGMQPALVLDGRRLELPNDLALPIADGARLSWLMPLAGG